VREYVFTRLEESEKEKLHIKAAEYFIGRIRKRKTPHKGC
jgi:hypothetical protein